MGHERIGSQLNQQGFHIGSRRKPDQINPGRGICIHDHAADFIKQALELVVGCSTTDRDKQLILDEFRRGSQDTPGGFENRGFSGNRLCGGFRTGKKQPDFLQFGNASEGPAQYFPRYQIIIRLQQVFQGMVQRHAPNRAGNVGLNSRINADFHPGSDKLFQDFDQRSVIRLKPEPVSFQSEIQRPCC